MKILGNQKYLTMYKHTHRTCAQTLSRYRHVLRNRRPHISNECRHEGQSIPKNFCVYFKTILVSAS